MMPATCDMDKSNTLFTQSKIIEIAIWNEKFCPMKTLDLDLDNFDTDFMCIVMLCCIVQ